MILSNCLQREAEFQPQNPILHPLRGAMPQQEFNVSNYFLLLICSISYIILIY